MVLLSDIMKIFFLFLFNLKHISVFEFYIFSKGTILCDDGNFNDVTCNGTFTTTTAAVETGSDKKVIHNL